MFGAIRVSAQIASFSLCCLSASVSSALYAGHLGGTPVNDGSVSATVVSQSVNESNHYGDSHWLSSSSSSSSGGYKRIECKLSENGDKWLQSSATRGNNAAGYGDGALQVGLNRNTNTGDRTKWRFLNP